MMLHIITLLLYKNEMNVCLRIRKDIRDQQKLVLLSRIYVLELCCSDQSALTIQRDTNSTNKPQKHLLFSAQVRKGSFYSEMVTLRLGRTLVQKCT